MNTTHEIPATGNEAWGFYGCLREQAEAAWEEQCRQILLGCIDSMEALSLEMLSYALALPSLEEHTLRSVFEEMQALEQI